MSDLLKVCGVRSRSSTRSVLTVQERLKTHSNAFDGLLSLIPAKYYYDDATQDQWQQTKRSKKEAAAVKRAKLDPDNGSTAIHVKAHREATAVPVVLPGERQKFNRNAPPASDSDESEGDASEKDQVNSDDTSSDHSSNESGPSDSESDSSTKEEASETAPSPDNLIPQTTLLNHDDTVLPETTGAPKPPITKEERERREANRKQLRDKLATRIQFLREKRHAPGTGPTAPKSRDEILAERTRKQELRQKRKLAEMEQNPSDLEDEDSEDDDADEEDGNEEQQDNILFGNIVFQDGSRLTLDLKKTRASCETIKKRGPARNDLKAHLAKLEAKRRRQEGKDPLQQSAQQEKDTWQRLHAQAENIKIKDDEKLLKRAIKRQNKQKLKSEVEWRERKQVVKDTVAARAKRVEENLKARRENKGKKGKHQPRLRKFTGQVNKSGSKNATRKRAGFEGSAKIKKKQK